jgi:hypothetical protein
MGKFQGEIKNHFIKTYLFVFTFKLSFTLVG